DGPDLTNIPFDLDNMIHDVYAYERQRFMDHTEALRERLEAEHRVQTDTQALRILPGRLAGIWRQTTRSAAARRRRIFELWDEIADDETGRRARAVVTRWVLENLPPGSEDAYSEAELARLNATRESPAPFSPY
ncbi:MAG: hypothetical protein H6719_34405, partial [Sandaracinaceae bacterium]|nr:hypothetical protein [Sandaracinaceae bacterium]